MRLPILLVCFAVLRPAAPARAGVAEQVPVGPRAIAMGGAFSAVADDAWSLYWNPAGLPWVGRQELSGSRARLFGSDVTDSYAGLLVPLSHNHAAGIDWYHSGLDDGGLDFGENRFGLSYGFRPDRRLSVGAALKFLTRRVSEDARQAGDGTGWGADVGILLRPSERWSFAIVGRDVLDTKLDMTGNGETVAYPRLLGVGTAWRVHDLLLAAADLDDRTHLGLEAGPLGPMVLRAGLLEDSGDGIGPTPTFGAGFSAGTLRFDYAFESHPVLGTTHHLGLSFSLNLNPARLRIEDVQLQDVYASLSKTYGTQPFGTVRLLNLKEEPLRVRLSLYNAKLMERPTVQEILLRPRAARDVPVTAVFSDGLLESGEDRYLQMEVTASYESARLVRRDRTARPCLVYAQGTVNWSHGAEQIAAFITPKDPVVAEVARAAVRNIPRTDFKAYGDRNLAYVSGILNTLSAMGFSYVPDPVNPYSERSGSNGAVDTIRYPRESLAGRTGDCDDTSALMASLLGNVGVDCRVVDVPGHLFLLVDTGLHERNREALCVPPEYYRIGEHRVWIPLETTAIEEGLVGAWQAGAATWRNWEELGQLKVVDFKESGRYEPVLPQRVPVVPNPDPAGAAAGRDADRVAVATWRRHFVEDTFGDEAGWSASPDTLNRVARARYLTGRSEEALALLEAERRLTVSARVENNLGAVHLSLGNAEAALEYFQAASRADPDDAGIWLNLALAETALGHPEAAAEAVDRGLALGGSYERACALLAIPPGGGANREGSFQLTLQIARTLLLSSVLLRRTGALGSDTLNVRTGTPDMPGGPADSTDVQREKTRMSPSLTSLMLSARAEEELDLAMVLYWKDE